MMEAIVLSSSEPQEKPKHRVDNQWMTSPKIKPDELTFEGEIGRGFFSVVSKGKCRGSPVAIKKLDTSDASQLSLLLDEYQRELEALHKMRHPNILQFLGTEQTSMCLVFELMSFSVNDLFYAKDENAPSVTTKLVNQALQRVRSTSLTSSSPLPTSSVEDLSKLASEKLTIKKEKVSIHHKMKILLGTASACAWLHGSKPPIIHGQLKPSNILLDSHWNIKIADFEIGPQIRALRRTKESFEFEQNFVWTSPEILSSSEVNEKSDVYSFAVCCWEILHEEKPFNGIFDNMKDFVDAVVEQELRPSISSRIPLKLKELIEWCWVANPNSRPTFRQIIPILEGALVDCHIDDPQGANFWKQYFLGQDEIKWNEFYDKIAHFLGLKVNSEHLDINGKCLKKLISDDAMEMVNCERFGFVLNAFGPLVVQHKGFSVLDKVRAAMAAEWFHGDISREIAENLLSNQKPGTFLVRISATDKNQPFTVSRVNSKSGIDHCRIQKLADGRLRAALKRDGQEKEYVTNKSSIAMMVKLLAKDLNLKTPCPGYPYKGVFSQTDSEGYLLDDE